jgi:predicted ATPase
LRSLALQSDFTDLEAGVLKDLIPDIQKLIGRPVANAPEIDSASAQTRLLNVVQDIFLRQKTPLVVLLEDLQWSNESLEIFRRLIPLVDKLPLMIIGSFRNDERPELPQELPGTKLIELERLSKREIAALSQSMIGEGGQQPQVVELLQRETEGNVFFIVEVMRALAEDAGDYGPPWRKSRSSPTNASGDPLMVNRATPVGSFTSSYRTPVSPAAASADTSALVSRDPPYA